MLHSRKNCSSHSQIHLEVFTVALGTLMGARRSRKNWETAARSPFQRVPEQRRSAHSGFRGDRI